MKTKLMTAAALMILFNTAGQAEDILFNAEEGWSGVSIGNELSGAGEPDLTEEERRQFREDKRRLVAAAKRLEEESRRLAAEAARKAAEEEKRAAAEARANDIYPEIYVTKGKLFTLYDDEHITYSFYPEISGWHIFQTYGFKDSVMEIYHNGQSIVNAGKSDGDDGIGNNELQHKYLEAGERYVVQVYLEYWTVHGSMLLNVRAEDPVEKLWDPLTLGYAKKVWLAPTRTHFTTKFTPKESGWYNIETFSDDEDTVMEIYHPDGYSMVAAGESDGDRGVGNEELQVKRFEAGKTYTIQVYMQDLDDEGFAWVHVWRSLREPINMS
ncbi:hypothetical protein [Bathymodiolus platifrons methanotrophic gill symbiont]|uniref:hypothetical protein n=1 Tax=Bathymodiolus platifrons methanotrophic gill symbiont TaxID=113268 RepID=UPI001C8DE875|nr:hypothetical protein [Bathymodiolus platifrons methanotrophic gill symbiont]